MAKATATEERPPVTTTAYDADGEAYDAPVDTRPADEQAEMPGFEKPELWDRFEGRRVTEVLLAFGGQCDLSHDPALARELNLRNEIGVTIRGTVIGKAYKTKTDKNGVVTTYGVATVQVSEVFTEGSEFNLDPITFGDDGPDDGENDLASSLAAAGVE